MRILIGTPIHQIKDYAMERWLKNVAELRKKYPCDFLMVDNSPNLDYIEKVKGYCTRYRIQDYKIEHLEINQKFSSHKRIEVSQEMIRRYVLSRDYDAWFSWECDQLIPTNALGKMIKLMKAEDFMIVAHNCWMRGSPTNYSIDMGCTLLKRECLEKNDFLPKHNDSVNLDASDCYMDMMFKQRVLMDGGNCIEAYGIIDPIYHLDK